MKKVLGVCAALCMTAFVTEAKITLPHVFGDNMVLQQQTEVKFWGKADPVSKVTVRPSWDRKSAVTVMSDADGKWQASVPTPSAGGPYTVEISDEEKLVLKNVLVGEVWLCSGQSNMEMTVRGFWAQPVEGSVDVIMKADPSTPVRFCSVKRATAFSPQEDCDARWTEHTPGGVANASATAYFFGRYLNEVLGVPVGLIITDWGGTAIQAWMDSETIEKSFPEIDLSFIARKEQPKNPIGYPSLIYNAMMAPLIPYTIKGMIWYQGEANRGKPEQYRRLQPVFVQMLREKWGLGEFPFYYVQIAPYVYDGEDSLQSAYLREAQLMNLEDIPNSGMAVTMDIGDFHCIHPAKKRQVGERLANLALYQTYGKKWVDPYSPVYDSWEMKDGKIIVKFKVGRDGLAPYGHTLGGFQVAGPDRVFHKATARIVTSETGHRDAVEVSCPEVKEPAAVRYGFVNCPEASLYNCFGMPASSFRTDSWPEK